MAALLLLIADVAVDDSAVVGREVDATEDARVASDRAVGHAVLVEIGVDQKPARKSLCKSVLVRSCYVDGVGKDPQGPAMPSGKARLAEIGFRAIAARTGEW